MTEHAASMTGFTAMGTREYNLTNFPITVDNYIVNNASGERNTRLLGVTYRGAGMVMQGGSSGLLRLAAWASRDVGVAAALYPELCPYGTAMKAYLNDVISECHDCMRAYILGMVAGGFPSYEADGMWCTGDITNSGNGWNTGYFTNSIVMQSALLKTPASIYLRDHFARFFETAATSQWDVAQTGASQTAQFNEFRVRATSQNDLISSMGNTRLASSVVNNNYTMRGPAPNLNGEWNPQAGDEIAFRTGAAYGTYTPFAAAVNYKKFYIVNPVGKVFQLASTPGGSPIPVEVAGELAVYYAKIKNFAPNSSYQGNEGYLSQLHGVVRMLKAAGCNVDTAVVKYQENFSRTTGFKTSRNAFALSYPE
jgi:hypothetical protein